MFLDLAVVFKQYPFTVTTQTFISNNCEQPPDNNRKICKDAMQILNSSYRILPFNLHVTILGQVYHKPYGNHCLVRILTDTSSQGNLELHVFCIHATYCLQANPSKYTHLVAT